MELNKIACHYDSLQITYTVDGHKYCARLTHDTQKRLIVTECETTEENAARKWESKRPRTPEEMAVRRLEKKRKKKEAILKRKSDETLKAGQDIVLPA